MAGNQFVFSTLGASNHVADERAANDYYATDPRAVEMLLEMEQFAPVIWEPACGEGHISKVLAAHGHEVISTDLIYRGFGDPEPMDFLTETFPDFEGDIITNPPYSAGLDFVKRALESVRPELFTFPVPAWPVTKTGTCPPILKAPLPMRGMFGKKVLPVIR